MRTILPETVSIETVCGVGERTEILAFGIVLTVRNALRVAFESTFHLSSLPVPHLHRAVITC